MNNGKRTLRLVLIVIAALSALGAVACIVCIATLKNNVLFIPMAVCLVAAMILFTYSRSVSD